MENSLSVIVEDGFILNCFKEFEFEKLKIVEKSGSYIDIISKRKNVAIRITNFESDIRNNNCELMAINYFDDPIEDEYYIENVEFNDIDDLKFHLKRFSEEVSRKFF